MKYCKRFENQLYDYVDGQLQDWQKKEIENHLKECSLCSTIFEDLKTIRGQLRNLKPLKTSSDFITVLRTRISMERSLHRRGLRNWQIRIPIYATVVALTIVAAVIILNPIKNKFISSIFNFSSTPIPSTLSDTNQTKVSNTDLQNSFEKIHYPMDIINLSERGISINSEELEKKSPAKPDSIYGSFREKVMHTVEF